MKHLIQERENVYQAFNKMTEAINSSTVLSNQTKELIKLASITTQGSKIGVGMHTERALNLGASKDEIIDTIVCCLPITGIPNVNQAIDVAMSIIEEFDRTVVRN